MKRYFKMMVYNDSEDCAPYMMFYTEEEAVILVSMQRDIIVDPLSFDQCLAYIWRTLPKRKQKLFNVFIIKNNHDWFKYYMTMERS